jgi:hypothetical protein
MKLHALFLFLCCCLGPAALAGEGNVYPSDPARAGILALRPYGVVRVYYCAECPKAAAWMAKDVKAAHDHIEKRRLPVILMPLTPELTLEGCTERAKENRLDQALMAMDAGNAKKISLKNIYQVEAQGAAGSKGKILPDINYENIADRLAKAEPASVGSYRYPVEQLTGTVEELWWLVERGQPNAIRTLQAAAQSGPFKTDAARILAKVDEVVAADFATLKATTTPTLDHYERLDALILEAGTLPALKDAAKLQSEWKRNKDLAPEILARDAWMKTAPLLAGSKAKSGLSGLEQIAQNERSAKTAYGKRAGALLKTLKPMYGRRE